MAEISRRFSETKGTSLAIFGIGGSVGERYLYRHEHDRVRTYCGDSVHGRPNVLAGGYQENSRGDRPVFGEAGEPPRVADSRWKPIGFWWW